MSFLRDGMDSTFYLDEARDFGLVRQGTAPPGYSENPPSPPRWDSDLRPVREGSPSSHELSPIQSLYECCSSALRVVASMQRHNPQTTKLYQRTSMRFTVWGLGLFDPQVALDRILVSGSSAGQSMAEGKALFREHVMGILAEIAVTLDFLLCSVEGGEYDATLDELLACIAQIPEIRAIVAEDPGFLQADTDDNWTWDRLYRKCGEYLGNLVECLFDVLPSIGTLREQYSVATMNRRKANQLQQSVDLRGLEDLRIEECLLDSPSEHPDTSGILEHDIKQANKLAYSQADLLGQHRRSWQYEANRLDQWKQKYKSDARCPFSVQSADEKRHLDELLMHLGLALDKSLESGRSGRSPLEVDTKHALRHIPFVEQRMVPDFGIKEKDPLHALNVLKMTNDQLDEMQFSFVAPSRFSA